MGKTRSRSSTLLSLASDRMPSLPSVPALSSLGLKNQEPPPRANPGLEMNALGYNPHHVIDLTPPSRQLAPASSPSSRTVTPALLASGRVRSTSVSSTTSNLSGELHLGGSWADRLFARLPGFCSSPRARAVLSAVFLLSVSVSLLYCMLRMLFPPLDVLSDEQKAAIKMPHNLEELRALDKAVKVLMDQFWWRVLGCWVGVYLFLQAFSIPGSMYLSILAGALYGVVIALPLVCFCVATGALLSYYISAQLGPSVLFTSSKWIGRVDTWKKRVQSHDGDLVLWLIALRIAPLPPHWFINILAPHLGISPVKFWISTFFGIMGVSVIHTQIGDGLESLASDDGDGGLKAKIFNWQNAVGLGAILLGVLIPIYIRKRFKKDLDEAAEDSLETEERQAEYEIARERRTSDSDVNYSDGSYSDGEGDSRHLLKPARTVSQVERNIPILRISSDDSMPPVQDGTGFNRTGSGQQIFSLEEEDETKTEAPRPLKDFFMPSEDNLLRLGSQTAWDQPTRGGEETSSAIELR